MIILPFCVREGKKRCIVPCSFWWWSERAPGLPVSLCSRLPGSPSSPRWKRNVGGAQQSRSRCGFSSHSWCTRTRDLRGRPRRPDSTCRYRTASLARLAAWFPSRVLETGCISSSWRIRCTPLCFRTQRRTSLVAGKFHTLTSLYDEDDVVVV